MIQEAALGRIKTRGLARAWAAAISGVARFERVGVRACGELASRPRRSWSVADLLASGVMRGPRRRALGRQMSKILRAEEWSEAARRCVARRSGSAPGKREH